MWHPLTVDQYEDLTPFQQARHRFEWGPLGSGQYYFREIWLNKMMLFGFQKRWAEKVRRDKAIVGLFALGWAVVAVLLAGPVGGLWLWFKLVVVPFLIFCHFIGWVVYVHHIAPDIRWWPRREWTRFRGQVEGTTVLWGPPLFDPVFHWIMVHLPHHVDMRIPCYRLSDAARAIAAAYPDYVDERRLQLRSYLRSVRVCKLYDFEAGRWLSYP